MDMYRLSVPTGKLCSVAVIYCAARYDIRPVLRLIPKGTSKD